VDGLLFPLGGYELGVARKEGMPVPGLCLVMVPGPSYRLVRKCLQVHGEPSQAASFYDIPHGDLGVHSAVHLLLPEQKITVAEITRQLGHRDWYARRADSDRQSRELESWRLTANCGDSPAEGR
jgi:hypothetical protein